MGDYPRSCEFFLASMVCSSSGSLERSRQASRIRYPMIAHTALIACIRSSALNRSNHFDRCSSKEYHSRNFGSVALLRSEACSKCLMYFNGTRKCTMEMWWLIDEMR